MSTPVETIVKNMDDLDIATALWWFIENVGPDHPSRDTLFFYLRERFRNRPTETVAQPVSIPPHVYWDEQGSRTFKNDHGEPMSSEFYREWWKVRDAFPQSRAEVLWKANPKNCKVSYERLHSDYRAAVTKLDRITATLYKLLETNDDL